MPTLTLIQSLFGHTDRIWTLNWNPQGTILASSGSDKSIRLWSKEGLNYTCTAILAESHLKTIRSVAWSPCGDYLASASFDSTICLWKYDRGNKTWSTIGNLEGHESEVKCVAWSPDGIYLASCGRDKSVWIWERADDNGKNGSECGEDECCAENWDCSDVKTDHTKDVKHITWHPVHNLLVSCSYDETLKIYHKTADEWSCCQTLLGHLSTVWSVDFSETGKYMVSCSDDKTLKIWVNEDHANLPNIKENSWKCCCTLQGFHERAVYDVSWCKLTNMIVSASGDNSLVIYKQLDKNNVNNGKQFVEFACELRSHHFHTSDINTVKWNPKFAGILASAGDDLEIKILNFNSD